MISEFLNERFNIFKDCILCFGYEYHQTLIVHKLHAQSVMSKIVDY